MVTLDSYIKTHRSQTDAHQYEETCNQVTYQQQRDYKNCYTGQRKVSNDLCINVLNIKRK